MDETKNLRQMPKKKDLTANKQYNDLLYGYLQTASHWDQSLNIRYLLKDEINYVMLAQELQVSRQTVSKWFEGLKAVGLVAFNENRKRYELTLLDKNDGELIPQATLRKIVNMLSHNAVNVYIYLIKKYRDNNGQPFGFTINELKEFCGLSVRTRSNNDKITDVLGILDLIGLINYEVVVTKGADGQVKSHYQLTYASKVIKDFKRAKVGS